MSGSYLAALDGLRALANCWIVAGHVHWSLGLPPNHDKQRLDFDTHYGLRVLMAAVPIPLEYFFFLSGFLATYHLVAEMQDPRKPIYATILHYIKRRVLRIVPAFYLTLLATNLATRGVLEPGALASATPDVRSLLKQMWHSPLTDGHLCNPESNLASLAFFQNWHLGGCVSQTWNLAIQMQFYVLFPFLLWVLQPRRPGFVGRVAAAAVALIAVGLSHRARAVSEHGLRMPVMMYFWAEGNEARVRDNTTTFVHNVYVSTLGRLPSLCMGILAACATVCSPSAHRQLRKFWPLLALLAVLSCRFLINAVALRPHVLITSDEGGFLDEASSSFAVVWAMGLLLPLASALPVLYIISGAGPLSRTLSNVLGHRVWKLPAQLSYSAYLIHFLVILAMWQQLGNPSQLYFADGPGGTPGRLLGLPVPEAVQRVGVFLGLYSAVQGVSYLAAYAMEVAVDKLLAAVGLKA